MYSVPDAKRIGHVPHAEEYHAWRAAPDRVDPQAYGRIHAELDRRFDENEVDTSSWIPGSDWAGTVWEPIYHSCGQNPVSAGLFVGLLAWQVVLDREDCWSFGRYERGGVPIRGMTYFRIDCPE